MDQKRQRGRRISVVASTDPQQWQPRMSPPENEFPAGIGLTAMLARTDDAAVGITQIEAFSTGFQFRLAVRVRQARPHLVPGRLMMLVSSHVHPGVEIPLQERLLLGIEYSDGQRASTLQDVRMSGPEHSVSGQPLILAQQGGSGGERSVDQTFWVSPLPPDGPMIFVIAWPAFGMPESQIVVDSAPIRAAADRSQTLCHRSPLSSPRSHRPHRAPPPDGSPSCRVDRRQAPTGVSEDSESGR